MANAWTWGVRFFAGNWPRHALILVGIGILVPMALRFALAGDVAMTSPADPSGSEAGPAAGIALAAGYVLQLASLFASWRLGFGRGETLGRALLFGMVAGVLVAVGFGLVMALVAAAFGVVGAPLAALLSLLWLMAFLALILTFLAGLLAVGICLVLALAMAFGTATGNMGFAATIVGGSGFVVVLLIVLSGVMLWLAARFSCTVTLMAERKSYNLFAAMRESWSLTWDDEWRIFRYLALLGLAAALLVVAVAVAGGAVFAGAFGGNPGPTAGIGAALIQIGLSVPVAFLTVLVPAGIHRELAGTPVPASAEVFA